MANIFFFLRDEIGQEICFFLLQNGFIPYLKFLNDWLSLGSFQDPYNEFLIQEMEQLANPEKQHLYVPPSSFHNMYPCTHPNSMSSTSS